MADSYSMTGKGCPLACGVYPSRFRSVSLERRMEKGDGGRTVIFHMHVATPIHARVCAECSLTLYLRPKTNSPIAYHSLRLANGPNGTRLRIGVISPDTPDTPDTQRKDAKPLGR